MIFIMQISNRIWAVNRAVFALFWWFRTMSEISIGTTANIYTHLDENNKLSSANAIIAILPEM